jgi:hypothetical protein
MTNTPIHLWIVGVVSLLWNAGGAMDYVMTRTGSAEYLAAQPEARLMLLEQAPLWFGMTWAIGVWLSVIGSALLLLRLRLASAAFGLSLLGLIGSSVYTYLIADGGNMTAAAGMGAVIFSIAIPVVLIGLWLYARAMARKGVLR